MFGFRKRPTTTTQPATETRASDLASPEEWLSLLFGATPTMAGVSVTPQNAMRSTPVRAAVEAIAETVGGLPCEIHAKALSGALSPATSHPAFALLHDHANDWTPASALIEQVTRDACLHGNGYVHIGRDGESIPRELIRLDPASISVTQDPATLEPVYRQSDANNQRIIPRSDLLHIRAPSVDGVSGASPEQLIGKLFSGGGASFASVLGFAEGGHVSGPGTGTSDSIPAALSDGEFVVNSRATAKHRGLLEAVNSGKRLPAFASGGFVGLSNFTNSFAPSNTVSISVSGGARDKDFAQQIAGHVGKALSPKSDGFRRGRAQQLAAIHLAGARALGRSA